MVLMLRLRALSSTGVLRMAQLAAVPKVAASTAQCLCAVRPQLPFAARAFSTAPALLARTASAPKPAANITSYDVCVLGVCVLCVCVNECV